MDAEAEQIREVFAVYGAAAYHVQCLERQVAICLATNIGPGPTRLTQSQYDDLLEQLFHETLGQLHARLRKAECPPELAADVSQCLEKRNWLTHHFFWDRAAAFNTTEGRAAMLSELYTLIEDFELLDARLTAGAKAWGYSHGVSEDDFDSALKDVLGGIPDSLNSRYTRKRQGPAKTAT